MPRGPSTAVGMAAALARERDRVTIGAPQQANRRTVRHMVVPRTGLAPCQLMVGLTELHAGASRVMHLIGEPRETRHVLAGEGDLALNPPWSVHSGVGLGGGGYSFVWVSGGENQNGSDFEAYPPATLL